MRGWTTSLLLLFIASIQVQAQGTYKETLLLMGSRFDITALAETDTLAWQAVQAGIQEISRIERLISSWDPASQTSAVNRNAGIAPVAVDKELYDLVFRAQKV